MTDIIALHDGTTLAVHGRHICKDQPCSVHRPSDHPLSEAPRDWCPVSRIMYRLCQHGYGHPDPDDLKVRTWPAEGRHTCDGCCEMRTDGLTGRPR